MLDIIAKMFSNTASCPLDEEEAYNILKSFKSLDKRVARIEKILIAGIIFIASLLIIDTDNGYSKEIVSKIHAANRYYCNEVDESIRTMLIELIRKELPFYPETGLCGKREIDTYVRKLLK